MKRLIAALAAAFCLSSCAVQPLYYWGGDKKGASMYEVLTYREFKKQTGESVCALICMYEDMVKHPKGLRKMPPPGVCAEYGYLLLQPETAVTFVEKASWLQKHTFRGNDVAVYFPEYGAKLLQMEIDYYPEAKQFIEPLLKRLAK